MKYSFAVAGLLLLVLTSGEADSQVTREDYRRADSLISLTSNKVFNSAVRPSWIGNNGVFFYECFTPAGTEYYIVSPSRMSKTIAFDQKKFAEAFEGATGQKAVPGKLPIRNVLFSERRNSFAFVWDDFNWICNIKDYSIVKGDRLTQRRNNGLIDWSFRDELSNNPVASVMRPILINKMPRR